MNGAQDTGRTAVLNMFCKIIVASVSVVFMSALSTVDTETYLDRVLEQYRQKIVKDGQRRTPVEIKATLIPRPDAFENPKNWTTDSALRLMYLIQANETAASVHQALRKMLASSTAARSSEIKLRGTAEQASPMATVLQIDNHAQADLPSMRIGLDTFMDLLLPEQTAAWLKSMTGAGSTATSPGKGRGGGGYGGSGGWGDGGSGGWGGGGWSGGWGGGESGAWGGGGSGGSGGGGSGGWGGGGSGGSGGGGSGAWGGGGGSGGWSGGWSSGGGPGGSSPIHYYYYYNGTHWVPNHSGTPSSNYGRPEKPGQPGRPAGSSGYYYYHNGTHWVTQNFETPSSNYGASVKPAEPERPADDSRSSESSE